MLSSPIWPILAGPFAGSLLGVLVRRLPRGQPVVLARSACEDCGRRLRPLELVPVLSYAALGGRCAGCGARIAPEHLAIELAAIVPPASAVLAGLSGAALWTACGLGWTLLALAWIDWRHLRLPDALTLPLLLAGLATTAWLDPEALTEHALAAALGYGALRLLSVTYRALRGRSGLGEGDAKLMAAIGAWQGLAGLSDTLLLGALLGLAYGLARMVARGGRLSDRIPLGPFLAVAAWIAQLVLLRV